MRPDRDQIRGMGFPSTQVCGLTAQRDLRSNKLDIFKGAAEVRQSCFSNEEQEIDPGRAQNGRNAENGTFGSQEAPDL
ncbi:hypothetical protein ROHU_021792 [Labeo rohita]|uniref:Uncharacterized protein n=1 Tax=Labeo rohita TaxID=84645 RepID=A0A498MZU5_LABRO|nr:hypothetical protein ROHU_021792 [Labeo rohita]